MAVLKVIRHAQAIVVRVLESPKSQQDPCCWFHMLLTFMLIVSQVERCVVECGVTSSDCYRQCATRLVPPKIVDGIHSISSIAEKIASVSAFLADPTDAVQSIASHVIDEIPNVIHEVPLPTPRPFPLPVENDDGDDDGVPILPFPLPDDIKPFPSILPFPLTDDDMPSPSDIFPNPLPKPADIDNDEEEDCDDDEDDGDYDNWDDDSWENEGWDMDEWKTIKGLPNIIPSGFDLPKFDLPDLFDEIEVDDYSRDIPSIKDLLLNMPKGAGVNHDLIDQFLRHAATTSIPLSDNEQDDKVKDSLQDVTNAIPGDILKDFPLDRDLLDQYLPKSTAPSSIVDDKLDEDKLKDMIQDLVDKQALPDIPLNALPSDIPLDALPSGVPLDALPSDIPLNALPSGVPLDALPSDVPLDAIPSDVPAGYAKSTDDEDDDEDDDDCDDDDDDDEDHKDKMNYPASGIPATPIVDPMPSALPTGSNMPVPDALPSDIAGALPSNLPAPYADAASDAAKLVAPADSQQVQSTVTGNIQNMSYATFLNINSHLL